MRWATRDQRAVARMEKQRDWHKRFAWVPVEADTSHNHQTVVWLDHIWQRKLGPYGPWERRVVEYHVAQLLTTKETQR